MLQYNNIKSGPMYNPARDIAYLGPQLIRTALTNILTDSPALTTYFNAGGSAEELNEFARRLAQTINLFQGRSDLATIDAILAESKLNDLPMRVLSYFGVLITGLMLGAIMGGVRETTYKGDNMRDDLVSIVTEANAFSKKLGTVV